MRLPFAYRRGPKLLVLLPVCAYVVSYLYLAYYHSRAFLFGTVVHEGGTYTLLQTTFYASHFLGHVPVHTMLAFLFAGSYLALAPSDLEDGGHGNVGLLAVLTALVLGASLIVGLVFFGYEDTASFVIQEKQSETTFGEGGSWNLHLPSSMLLFALVPPYIYIFRRLFGKKIGPSSSGLPYIFVGFAILLGSTLLINGDIFGAILHVWTQPRYLAHSVRELLTFPVTYFPIPLYFLLRKEKAVNGPERSGANKILGCSIALLAIILIAGALYQSYISLGKGIGEMAQKPDFAHGGRLGIPYLLASHYFEHFIDTIYFTLLCLLLCALAAAGRSRRRETQ